jgi:Caudovirus prohead serine protease
VDRKTGVRKLLEIRLWEISLVTFPANDLARVTSVEAAAPELERLAALVSKMKAAALELRAAAILNEMRATTLDNQKGGPSPPCSSHFPPTTWRE